ncbi:FIST N-terminal domain-containing protein [Tabrizicola fusiformis]|uniref:FIST N-terminal domain-containing protein n=1 Tax=Tabrizicola sp. SY72 TaxID=2741673 RepID=UPI00157296FD|nr:FIST N-terminal domain-containing protein [Tabrizicola sp. SY72]NTT86422.1 FIST C-terminal domain-containing protein [Tabrizicola sp. SY72]
MQDDPPVGHALPASIAASDLLRRAAVPARHPEPAAALAAALGDVPLAVLFLFVSPEADLAALAARLPAVFGALPVIGCTTAGEISAQGYSEGEIVAVGLPAALYAATPLLIPDLGQIEPDVLIGQLIRARQALMRAQPGWEGEFAFLLVDGLSVREDELAAALARGLGPVPLFGGSAGDGTRFQATHVLAGGRILRNAAVVTLVRTAARVKVFSLDHLRPTERRMVVTEADPARRIVRRINAEPAAQEYARLLGKDPGQLDTFTFAAHPVVVRIGGTHHVRAIQQVHPNGDLVFFSAIDEGVVLTLAEPSDMVTHLSDAFSALAGQGAAPAILACDCILRRLEAQEKQQVGAVSALLRRHGVVGFSTYGEQLNAMHVNHTMTGVALYPPEEGP